MDLIRMKEQIAYYQSRLLKRQNQALKINTWLNLINKIETFESYDETTKEMVTKAYNALNYYVSEQPTDRKARREYLLTYSAMMKHFKKTHDYVVRGSYITICMAAGIIIGAGAGVLVSTVETTRYAMAIALGMLLGIFVGNHLESKLNKEGKLI